MINKKSVLIGMIFVFGIILSLSFINPYSTSNPQFSQYQSSPSLFNWQSSLEFNDDMCKEGQDFLIQMAPFGCTPAVVRSDLLEEQNVPVFCQLAATKINPLIDVQAIESLSFSGQYPKEVSGVGFEPYRSALGGKGDLNTPAILDNIGYAVIILKKQPNESAMPDYVEGNLTIKIKYDIKNAFGIGKTSLYLPVLTDDDWEERKEQYSFWKGKGYIRAEGIEENRAKITIYDGTGKRYKSVTLNEGETSEKIYLPGFYCLSSLELTLRDLEAPETRAKFLIDGNSVEIREGEKFLEDRCTVIDLYEAGILSRATIRCKEDESGGLFGRTTHVLSVVPRIKLSIGGEIKEYGIGDWLYEYKEPNEVKIYHVYLGYANTKGNTGREKDLEIGLISIPESINPVDNKLDESTLEYVGKLAGIYGYESSKQGRGKLSLLNAGRALAKYATGLAANIATNLVTGKAVTFISKGEINVLGEKLSVINTKTYGNIEVRPVGFAEPVDFNLDSVTTIEMKKVRDNYDLAKKDFNTISVNYPLEKTDDKKTSYGEEALGNLIILNDVLNQKRTVVELCEKFEKDYENPPPPRCKGLSISNSDINTALVNINGKTSEIIFNGVYEPSISENSAEITVRGPNGKIDSITLSKGREIFLDDFRGRKDEPIELGKVSTSQLSYTSTNLILENHLYVTFDSSKNNWSYNIGERGWIVISQNVVKNEGSLHSGKKELLLLLENLDFEEGKRIILTATKYVGESMELISLDDEEARVRISVSDVGVTKTIAEIVTSDSYTLDLDKLRVVGGYSFTLSKVNLKKSALVTINPGIDNTGSETNFSFKIGIEKRGIELSPAKINRTINKLNKSIEKWNETSFKLGKVVKGLKGACLVAGVGLTVKNFFSNLGGRGIARQKVMRGELGWFDICSKEVKNKISRTLEECYSKYSDQIDQSVEAMNKFQNEQSKEREGWEEGAVSSGGFFQDSILNKSKSTPKAILGVQDYWENNPGRKTIKVSKEKSIDLSKYVTSDLFKSSGGFSQEDLNELKLNARILDSSESTQQMKDAAEKRYNSIGLKIYGEVKDYQFAQETANLYEGIGINDAVRVSEKNTQRLSYTGKTGSDFKGAGIGAETRVQLVSHSQGDYLVVLEKSVITGEYGIKKDNEGNPTVYDARNPVVALSSENIPKELKQVIFEQRDESSYKNKGFSNPTIHFYETPPYDGLPAIVPIDTKNGWYVATKQTLPSGGGIAAFGKSGRVSSFYLCHVGNNGVQQFNSGLGDDTCEMVNLGTGQAYNQFPGLSKRDAEKYIKCGVKAIEQASRAYKSGRQVKINTACGSVTAKVGTPAINVPSIQCEDFMSPSDCRILYNLCDPVICPSSRCNLGGSYPVKDPIQTGIIGGFVLCLPNFPQVYVPLCLTGIQAGIDGLVSVFVSYRNCLQEQLDTGKTVGICDELYSFYMCDLLWKQALPFAEVALPKLISSIAGQGSGKGGGEYLGVKSAWDTASKSFSFFTQNYAVNSFKAFRARSTEQLGTEVCKSFISGVVPSMEMFDQFTEPDSPFQFYGRFDEIPFTSTTNPPISQYKVYYHIYAGKDSSAYYKVYLRGSPDSSFYRDASQSRLVAQGHIPSGGIASETKDFTAPSGYRELCINVNGQEECGFKQVTTNLAVNYVRDQYIKEQASATNIKSESECISGSSSVYSLLNPNVQAGADELLNPGVYNYGITRICSTANPGKETDSGAGGEKSRWVEVGYCGNQKIKCWMDTSKIDDITRFKSTENETLAILRDNTLKLLKDSGKYLDEKQIRFELITIAGKDNVTQIRLLTELLGKVFLNSDKAKIYIERGKIYTRIAQGFFAKEKKRLEEARTKELEAKKKVEIKERVEVGEWWLTPGLTQAQINKINESRECENCGNKITCTKQICDIIGRLLKKNCEFSLPFNIPFLGTCHEKVEETLLQKEKFKIVKMNDLRDPLDDLVEYELDTNLNVFLNIFKEEIEEYYTKRIVVVYTVSVISKSRDEVIKAKNTMVMGDFLKEIGFIHNLVDQKDIDTRLWTISDIDLDQFGDASIDLIEVAPAKCSQYNCDLCTTEKDCKDEKCYWWTDGSFCDYEEEPERSLPVCGNGILEEGEWCEIGAEGVIYRGPFNFQESFFEYDSDDPIRICSFQERHFWETSTQSSEIKVVKTYRDGKTSITASIKDTEKFCENYATGDCAEEIDVQLTKYNRCDDCRYLTPRIICEDATPGSVFDPYSGRSIFSLFTVDLSTCSLTNSVRFLATETPYEKYDSFCVKNYESSDVRLNAIKKSEPYKGQWNDYFLKPTFYNKGQKYDFSNKLWHNPLAELSDVEAQAIIGDSPIGDPYGSQQPPSPYPSW